MQQSSTEFPGQSHLNSLSTETPFSGGYRLCWPLKLTRTLFMYLFVYLIRVCWRVHTCTPTGQLSGVGSRLPSCGSQESNLGCEPWQQAPLPRYLPACGADFKGGRTKNGGIYFGTVKFEIPGRQPNGMKKPEGPGFCPGVDRKPPEWM